MGQDATEMVLKTSVLGTFRVFMVMLAGLLASKLPKRERELVLSAAYLSNLPAAFIMSIRRKILQLSIITRP